MKKPLSSFVWESYHWQRPFSLETVWELLSHLASLAPRGFIVLEARSGANGVRYLIGAEPHYFSRIHAVFHAHGQIQFQKAEDTARKPVACSRTLRIGKPVLSLNTNAATAAIRAELAALVESEEEAVVQAILGRACKPAAIPKDMPDPNAGWLQVIMGTVSKAPLEYRKSAEEKARQHGFQCLIRIGAAGKQAVHRLDALLSAMRTLESAGVRIHAAESDPARLMDAHLPWQMPLKLSVKEVTPFLLLPAGEEAFSGISGLHPKALLPPAWYLEPKEHDKNARIFATSNNGQKLSISPTDALEHTHILGPTGSGKSTAMLHLILADIQAGRSVLVIDPKADLVRDVLERLPRTREEDVVIIDPSDACPVGFNPLAFSGQDPTLIADSILAVLQQIFKEYWGIRTQDILSAALITLARTKGSSLLWLPALLTEEDFRHRIVSRMTDRIGLLPFWQNFEAMKENERRTEIAPVLNKLRQLTFRPGLRNVLGQATPKFSYQEMFCHRKIVLVPLNKGILGAESARLLGSLIVGLTWTLALSRAQIPPEKRHMVSIFIDELQDYISLPTDLSDALSQARGLGVAMTLSHQYRSQLPPEIRAGIDTNTRNKIIFGLSSSDAKEMANMASELEAADFMSLSRYQIYTTFGFSKKSTGWIQGKTHPPSQPIRIAAELKAASMERYGRTAEEVEAALLQTLHQESNLSEADTANGGAIGRRKRP